MVLSSSSMPGSATFHIRALGVVELREYEIEDWRVQYLNVGPSNRDKTWETMAVLPCWRISVVGTRIRTSFLGIGTPRAFLVACSGEGALKLRWCRQLSTLAHPGSCSFRSRAGLHASRASRVLGTISPLDIGFTCQKGLDLAVSPKPRWWRGTNMNHPSFRGEEM